MLEDCADDEAFEQLHFAGGEEHFELRQAFGMAEGGVQRGLGDEVEGVGTGLARVED